MYAPYRVTLRNLQDLTQHSGLEIREAMECGYHRKAESPERRKRDFLVIVLELAQERLPESFL